MTHSARIEIETRLLHLLARVAVRVETPLRAKRMVFGVARFAPTLTVSEAKETARFLEGAGTCLTRALTIASRLPESEVVIGSDGMAHRFAAHAWVEWHGQVVGETTPSRYELARL